MSPGITEETPESEPKLEPDPAITLLSQQCWCWGQDIVRPEGNWLVEIGFERLPPPQHDSERGSVYRLRLPHDRLVILRGFGVLFGAPEAGGIFLPRYEFTPQYTTQWPVDTPPWTIAELPPLERLNHDNHYQCAMLTQELLEWMTGYERQIVERLGRQYREQTLTEWDNGERRVFPAEQMVGLWEQLTEHVENRLDSILRGPLSRADDVVAHRLPTAEPEDDVTIVAIGE